AGGKRPLVLWRDRLPFAVGGGDPATLQAGGARLGVPYPRRRPAFPYEVSFGPGSPLRSERLSIGSPRGAAPVRFPHRPLHLRQPLHGQPGLRRTAHQRGKQGGAARSRGPGSGASGGVFGAAARLDQASARLLSRLPGVGGDALPERPAAGPVRGGRGDGGLQPGPSGLRVGLHYFDSKFTTPSQPGGGGSISYLWISAR